jgi:hypothetical protein
MTASSAEYGVRSEVGRLRKVLVCSPGLAHERLTPTNCDDLLFDDVLWVQNPRLDHFDFMDSRSYVLSKPVARSTTTSVSGGTAATTSSPPNRA